MSRLWRALTRVKTTDGSTTDSDTKLARVLNLFDLTALGVGSTLGLGVYVLAGSVAHDQAGPAVTLSFLIAAIASSFAGICYAEFAARVPKAGSAYVYSYVTIGEFVAFTIGWNLILEYVIGTASVARGLSGYLDFLLDNKMSAALKESMPITAGFLGDYPDFLSFGMVLLLTCLLAFGVKESSFLNNIFTCVNLVTVLIVLIAGGMNGKLLHTFRMNIFLLKNIFFQLIQRTGPSTLKKSKKHSTVMLVLVVSCLMELLELWLVQLNVSMVSLDLIVSPPPEKKPSTLRETSPCPL